MTGHVFISYSHETDSAYAERLAGYLTRQGVEVWFDRDIVGGQRWQDLIEDRIQTCAALIVIMSPAAHASEWVHRELGLGKACSKQIYPVLLAGSAFPSLHDIQYEDVSGGRMPSYAFVKSLPQRRIAPVAPLARRGFGVKICELPTHGGRAARSLAFSSDGHTLAIGHSGGMVELWSVADAARPTLATSLAEHQLNVATVDFAADGLTLVSASAEVVFWDLPSRQRIGVLPAPPAPGNGLQKAVFSAAGELLAVSRQDPICVQIWDFRARSWPQLLGSITGMRMPGEAMVFRADDTLLVLGGGQGLGVFDVRDPYHPVCLGEGSKHCWVRSIDFSADWRLAATASMDEATLWDFTDAAAPTEIAVIDVRGQARAVAFDREGSHLLVGGCSDAVFVWDVVDPSRPTKVGVLSIGGDVECIKFSPDGRLFAIANRNSVQIWQV